MPRESFVYDRELCKLVPKAEFYARQVPEQRSDLPRPMIISDLSEAVYSHADGRFYSSKKHWRDHLKAHGMVELGNDKPEGPEPTPAITERDIAEAYQQCEQGAGAKAPEQPPEHWEGDPVELAMESD